MRKPIFIFYLSLLMACKAWAADVRPQSLLDVYQQARASDPVWAAARNAHAAAQEKLVQGKALLLPTVTLSASVAHNQTDISSRPGNISQFSYNGFDKYESYGYRVDINQPLFRKQNGIQYEQSKTLVSQADIQLAQAQQELMVRVAQAYFDVLLAQDRIDLIVAQKAAITQQLEQAKANFEIGTATITDVHEAQARFDLTVAQEIAASNDLEVKKRAIQSLTGQRPERLATVRSDIPVTLPEPREMEKWVEIAEKNNYALKMKQAQLIYATQEVERAHAGHLPTLDLVGSYSDTRANGGVAQEIRGYNDITQSGMLGLKLEIPLYQGGAITSKEREALVNKQKALDEVEAARREADLQVRQSFLNVSSAVAQVKAYEQALASSQSQLDSTQLGYEVGVRTSVDVLNAQQQFYSAKRDLLQARYNWLLSLIKLKAAAGILTENDLIDANRMLEDS
ncbi:MAG: TolC family outer membrane protein [Methylophilaceae bacterium]|nr:TolC family outer membrane protein [Methylophilaceae bacterium]